MSLLAPHDGRVPRIKGWLGSVPVCNLADMFGANAGTYAAGIRTAYGIAANGSDYATLTDGHDPVLLDPEVYAGMGMMFISSPSDTIVDEAENSETMFDLVNGVAYEATHLHHTGDHGDVSSYEVALDNAIDFFARCVAIPDGTGGGTNTDLWYRLKSIAAASGMELIEQ